jgi:polyisoprenyl-phosphate glycosyltransferase
MNANVHTLAVPVAARDCTLSVVVPVFNEQEVLPVFHSRLVAALSKLDVSWEIVYVNDGSTDNSLNTLRALHHQQPAVAVINLSRNFGKEGAMCAGLKMTRGEAVVLIDADLQDPPELIADMVQAWRGGADVVNMQRRSRQGDTWVKKTTAQGFYRIINLLSEVPIAVDVGDFRLLSRRAVDALAQLPERSRFMKGLFAWIGFNQVTLRYDRHPRAAGQTKWPYLRLLRFAMDGITGFSVVPLRLASYTGFLVAFLAFAYALMFLVKTLLYGDVVQGFPTLIVTILLLGGLQLMAIGILGEYMGRLFMQSKQRPLYFISDHLPAAPTQQQPRQRTLHTLVHGR